MKVTKFIFLIIFFFGINSYSCNCQKTKSVRKEFNNSELVFVGTVISIRIVNYRDSISTLKLSKYDKLIFDDYFSVAPYKKEVTVLIQEKYKGSVLKKEKIIITTGIGNGDCGFPFKVGNKYLIYVNKENIPDFLKNNVKANYFTSICTRTKKFNLKAEKEVIKIKKCLSKIFVTTP